MGQARQGRHLRPEPAARLRELGGDTRFLARLPKHPALKVIELLGDEDKRKEDERNVILRDIAPKAGVKFFYEYDMGDSWGHEIRVEAITPAAAEPQRPVCLAGAGACPPEDCGGIGGYEDLLAALRDAKHEQHDEMVEWVGGDFDPEAFDLDAANKALGRRKR